MALVAGKRVELPCEADDVVAGHLDGTEVHPVSDGEVLCVEDLIAVDRREVADVVSRQGHQVRVWGRWVDVDSFETIRLKMIWWQLCAIRRRARGHDGDCFRG